MTNARIGYRPASGDGAWWLAVDGDALVLLSPTVSAETAAGVWQGLGAGGIGAVLEALTGAFGTSLTAIPPFALAIVEAAGVRVAVRGDVELVAEGDGAEAVSGAGVATWTERFLPGVVRVTVAPGGGGPVEVSLPLRSGVVRADLVALELGAPIAVSRPAAPAGPEEIAEAEEQPAAVSSSASVIDSVPPGLSGARTAAAAEPEGDPAPVSPAVTAPEPEPEAPPTGADTSADTLIPEATAAEDAGLPPVDEYDLLWGETVARPVSAAAIVVSEPDGAPESEGEAGVAAATPSPVDASTAAPADDLGDHDGATIAVADLRAMRAERAAFESTDSVPARRPARGRIRLSTGRVVELERPVIIGRRPKSTRTSGAELPTLVAVDSPEQDISRSHVEIRAEGEHVLVTDLDTTNGTVLLRGGNEPVRLHPHEPTMVVSGDVLDLGDDVTVTFEDLP